MAEPDVGGIAGLGQRASDAVSVFRGKGSVSIEYRDVKGLVSEMEKLAKAVKSVKDGLESIGSGKSQKALTDLKALVSGAGGASSNAGNVKFSSTGKGADGGDGKSSGFRSQYRSSGGGGDKGFDDIPPNGGGVARFAMAAGGAGLGAMALIGAAYARRAGDDLSSDLTAARMVYTSDRPSFGLRQATNMMSSGLGPFSTGRADMQQGMAALTGRFGTPGSAGMNSAMSMAGAYAMGSMQGTTFGADMVNRMANPVVLNRVRMFGGGSRIDWNKEGATGAARTMGRIAFGSATPTAEQLANFRPGTPQFNNMVFLAGGDTGAAQMQVELLQAEQRYKAIGSPRGRWNDETLKSIGRDHGLQEQLFGERSLFLSKQQFESGKAVDREDMLSLTRNGLVDTNDLLANIYGVLQDVQKRLPGWFQPLGNLANQIGGPIADLSNVLQTFFVGQLAVRGPGIPGPNNPGGLLAGGLGGKGGGIGGVLGAAGVVGVASMAGQAVDSAIGNPKSKNAIDWGNIGRYTAMGAGVGLAGGPLAPISVLGGTAAGFTVGVAKEFGDLLGGIGDPVDSQGGSSPFDQHHVGDPVPGGGMSLSQAEDILRSRGGHVSGIAGLQPDFKIKVAQLFQMNPKLSLSSGARSSAEQKRLYDRWVRRVPGQAPAAKPGTSNHEFGLAVDIGPSSQYGWLAANAPKVGLVKPMDYEPWHWEPPNAKSRRKSGGVPEAAAGGAEQSAAVTRTTSVSSSSIGQARSGLGSTTQGGPGTAAPPLIGVSIGSSPGGGTAVGSASTEGSGGVPFKPGAGSITINQAANFLRAAGIPESQIPTGVAIGMAESHLRPGAHNPNASTGDNSYGIWQINMIGKMGPDRRNKLGITNNDALFDPATNARAAAMISGGGSNWHPWSTFGKHEKYMGQVKSALASGVGDPVEAAPSSAGMMGTSTVMLGTSGGTQVRAPIYLQVMSASEEEAIRMAKIIQGHLQGVVGDVETARTGG